jgi:hypothetical protein
MKRLLIFFLLLFSLARGEAQTTTTSDRVVTKSLYLRDWWVDSVKRDTNFLGGNRSIPTAAAVYNFVAGRGAPGYTSVTSLPDSSGLVFHGPNGLQDTVVFEGETGGSGSSLPSMTGNEGKYLTTDGSAASWKKADPLATDTARGWYNVEDYGITPEASATTNAANLNTLLATIGTVKKTATIYFPKLAVYNFDGDYQDPTRGNCVIKLPSNAITDAYYPVVFKGAGKPVFSPSAYSSQPLPAATVLKTTKATGSGTLPSFFGGYGPVGGENNECSYVEIGFEDLIIQLPNNPQLTGINLKKYTQTILRNVAVITEAGFSVMNTTEPTSAGVYGIIQPDYSSGCYQRLDGSVFVVGFYNGIRVGENCLGDDVEVYSCNKATVFDFSHGVSRFHRLSVGWSKTHLAFNAAHAVQIGLLNTERWVPNGSTVLTKWFDFVQDVDDAGNNAKGEIIYHTGQAMVGWVPAAFTMTGGENDYFYVHELGARPTGSTSPSPSTLLWEDSFNDTNDPDIAGRTTPVGAKTWTANTGNTGVVEIILNEAKLTTDGTNAGYVVDAGTTDLDLRFTLGVKHTAVGVFPYGWAYLAYSDQNNYIICYLPTGEAYKKVAGTQTQLFAGNGDATSVSQGMVVRFVLMGNSLKYYRNATLVQDIDVTGHGLTGTKCGMLWTQDNISTIDKISCYAVQ